MRVHDLNSRAHLSLGGAIFFLPSRPRWSCVRRTIRICATHGVSAAARIQRLRQPLQRQWPIAWFFVSRSILVPELRAIDVSRKSAGYRNVPASARAEVASRGFSRQSVAQHVGRCKPRSRLANLCRLRPSVDSSCSPVVRARAAGGRSQAGGLCARLHDHRFVLEFVSLGQVSPSQGSRQAAHALGLARQHSLLCACFPRENARCHRSRPTAESNRAPST